MNTSPHPLEERIRLIIAQVSPIRPEAIHLDHTLRGDLSLDSVASMELVSMLCEAFDIDVEIGEAMEVEDVRAAIDMVERHLKNR